MAKSTRIVYTDKLNLDIYKSLPEKDFKEFFMAYLTYQKGGDIDGMFTSLLAKTVFMTYISKIEYNEEKWEKQAKVNRENGKKGGRPKKTDLGANTEFETETDILYQVEQENPTEVQEMPKNEVIKAVEQDDETEPDMSRVIPIEDRVKKMFGPIYNDFSMTNDVDTFGKAIDKSIDILIVEYDDVDRQGVRDLFKKEYMKRKTA